MSAPRLLIADDCPQTRTLVRTFLESMVSAVAEAANGRELFWMLEAHFATSAANDLVVVADVAMPIYDGLDVLEAWETAEPACPCVVTSSSPDEATRQRVAHMGALLLPKPFSGAELRRTVRRAVRRRSEAHRSPLALLTLS